MNEKGFTLTEVVVSLLILVLLVSIVYPFAVSLQNLQIENKVYQQVIERMNTSIELWRLQNDLISENFMIEQVEVTQSVYTYLIHDQLEVGEFEYRWQIGKRNFEMREEVKRYMEGK